MFGTQTEHKDDLAELTARLNTNVESGMTTAAAEARRAEEGRNQLMPPKTTPVIVKFLLQMFGGFSTLLWVGSILCFIAYGIIVSQAEEGDTIAADNLYLGIVLAAVVVITGIFSFYQEGKADNIMKSFAKLTPPMCKCRRNGELVILEAWELVRGDIVEVCCCNRHWMLACLFLSKF